MSKTITINPLTRISGFLEIQVKLNNQHIENAFSSGMLFRGFEKMLEGRPPLDAIYFTQRICGICSTAHSMASTLALESILDIKPSFNDRLLRDFIHGCEFLQNHLRHFYLYTFPDFVKGPQISPVYKKGIDDYRLPSALNEQLANHYLESIQYSRLAHKMIAILAGKAPHNHGIFVGGVTINLDAQKYIEIKSILSQIKAFVDDVMVEDIMIISRYYDDYFTNGKGYGNFMSYGVFTGYDNPSFEYVKPGVLINNTLSPLDLNAITENIKNAWYVAENQTLKPLESESEVDVHKENAYSFVKAPRYNGTPLEVGPLARMWISGEYTRGVSTMDRMIARVLETQKISQILTNMLDEVVLQKAEQAIYEFPDKAEGVGIVDTTRGALGHWIKINDKKIEKYTIITPTSWNLSPTDARGYKGVTEQALMGTILKNIEAPVEIGRIVRSFDPCVSCATHVTSNLTKDLNIRVV